MQFVSASRRATARLVAVVAAVLLALVASVLVAPGAQALTDTGDGGVFVPTIGRILDTANNIGYNTPMAAGEWRTVKVAGLAGVPADGSAGAVSVIATVAEMPGQGQLTGRPNAQTLSTLMTIYAGGGLGNTSNSAILALNSDGTIQVQTETKARLILDVQGYYTSNKDGTTAGGLVTVPGARIADTRSGLGVAKAQLKSGDTTTVQVTGTAGVPKGASAVVVNLIAINTSTVNGFLTPYAAGTTRPKNSLNYGSGNVPTSITAQVPLSADGKMTVYNQSSTVDLVVDVQGYFTAAGNTGAMFTPGTGRLYDTRTGSNTIIGNGETRSIQAAGGHTPAAGSGITAVVITLTALHAANSSGGATVWAEGAARPGTTSINFTPNSIRSNTITVPVSASGKINLNNVGDPTHYVLDVQGWYLDPQIPSISCPMPYAANSWTATAPSSPVNCTVTAPIATAEGQTLRVLVDSDKVVESAMSSTAVTRTTVSVNPLAGIHHILAFGVTASEEVVTGIGECSFAAGEWTDQIPEPIPAVDSEPVNLQPTIDVAPALGAVFPADVDFQISVSKNADGVSDPVYVSPWTSDGITVPSALEDATTYYWTAVLRGSGHFDGTMQIFRTPVWSFVTDARVPTYADAGTTASGGPVGQNLKGFIYAIEKTLVQRDWHPSKAIAECYVGGAGGTCSISKGKTASWSVDVAFGVGAKAIGAEFGWSKSQQVTISVGCTSGYLKGGSVYKAYPVGERYKYKLQIRQGTRIKETSQWLWAFTPRDAAIYCR
jgi:WD40 repeat protein